MSTDAEVRLTYADRRRSLLVDDSQAELGQKNESENPYNRSKVTQRDLGRFEHHRKPYASAVRHLARKVQVIVEFTSRDSTGQPNSDPAVVDYGPKRLTSKGTNEFITWHWTGTFSAKMDTTPVEVGPEVEAGKEGSFVRHHATHVWSADWGNRHHKLPNCVKFYMEEDEKQADGVPLELLASVIVVLNGSDFQATTTVKADAVFNLLAMPWTKDDPVLFKESVAHGSPVGTGPVCEFATLTEDDWRGIVTPHLEMKQRLHQTISVA